MTTAKSLGFKGYDDYMLYQRKAKELSLEKRFLGKGIASLPSYNNFESVLDGYIPARIKRSLENA